MFHPLLLVLLMLLVYVICNPFGTAWNAIRYRTISYRKMLGWKAIFGMRLGDIPITQGKTLSDIRITFKWNPLGYWITSSVCLPFARTNIRISRFSLFFMAVSTYVRVFMCACMSFFSNVLCMSLLPCRFVETHSLFAQTKWDLPAGWMCMPFFCCSFVSSLLCYTIYMFVCCCCFFFKFNSHCPVWLNEYVMERERLVISFWVECFVCCFWLSENDFENLCDGMMYS